MRWIEANGASFRYELSGRGAQTLVLVHEAGGSLESFDAVVPLLSVNHRVLRYDQRGFGMSERPACGSIDAMVADLRALLLALAPDVPRTTIIGTAIGGTIALSYAACHPNAVARVIAASPVTGDLPATAGQMLEQRAQALEQRGMRAVVEAALEKSYPPALRHDADAFAQYRARLLACDPHSFAALSRTYLGIDLRTVYARIACPTLLIGCRDDAIKPPDECAAAAAAITDGRYIEAASGHFIALQAPGLFARLIEEFLETTPDAIT